MRKAPTVSFPDERDGVRLRMTALAAADEDDDSTAAARRLECRKFVRVPTARAIQLIPRCS